VKFTARQHLRNQQLIDTTIEKLGGIDNFAQLWVDLLNRADELQDFDLKLKCLEHLFYVLQAGDNYLLAWGKCPKMSKPSERGVGSITEITDTRVPNKLAGHFQEMHKPK
jgi:hypothetical protein